LEQGLEVISRRRRLRDAALRAATVAQSLERTGFTIRAQIIWAKPGIVIGRGDYHWRHEPCWYAVRKRGYWTGDRKQTTVWEISSKDQDAKTAHSTQKPVECMRRPMLNNSDPGQTSGNGPPTWCHDQKPERISDAEPVLVSSQSAGGDDDEDCQRVRLHAGKPQSNFRLGTQKIVAIGRDRKTTQRSRLVGLHPARLFG
jgi:hypothetical protein